MVLHTSSTPSATPVSKSSLARTKNTLPSQKLLVPMLHLRTPSIDHSTCRPGGCCSPVAPFLQEWGSKELHVVQFLPLTNRHQSHQIAVLLRVRRSHRSFTIYQMGASPTMTFLSFRLCMVVLSFHVDLNLLERREVYLRITALWCTIFL